MEVMDGLVSNIMVPTEELKTETLQALMLKMQRPQNVTEQSEEIWNKIIDVLWTNLECGLESFDDQLLCAICFYTVLMYTQKDGMYLSEILRISEEQYVKNDSSKISQILSLTYGMYQSSYLLKVSSKEKTQLKPILTNTTKTMIAMAYDYAWYTFIVFKTINSFKKVLGTTMKEDVFTKENQIKLLNLVNNNWENPITGVRDLNKVIFQTLISVIDETMYDTIVGELNEFYWNKAKYLMLSEIIVQNHKFVMNLLDENDWIQGLVDSLYKPGLVSAGADMYFAVLKRLNTDSEWCSVFLEKITKVMTGLSDKAIENFTNYWCLTSFKKFPSLMDTLIKEIEIGDEDTLYSQLCIMKQGNKLGLLENKWDSDTKIYKSIITGLEDNNVQIRMLAFDIVCVSYGKLIPHEMEYDLVYQYLFNNTNSDSTVLRINMLSSLKLFLTRIHMYFLNNKKDSKEVVIDEYLLLFCRRIQELILMFLEIGGNYQRKITSIKLCDIFITYFTEVPKKKKPQTKISDKNLLNRLKEKGYWKLAEKTFTHKLIDLLKDPADDVRENVAKILFEHYFEEFRNTNMFFNLIQNALNSIRSKFFYEISCGQSMFKLIVNIVLKQKQNEGEFRSAEDIFMYGCNELNAELKTKRDIMESIENGKQLHSFICILHAVLEVCQQNSYKLQNINNSVIIELLNNLDGISNQFAWEEQGTMSCDFSELSQMVHDMIVKAGYKPHEEADQCKISGLHQIVLNCMWLNVKACCELSSLLIKDQSEDCHAVICTRSLKIITHVLETSRHKGAIEAAGAALGESIRHLTSLSKESELSKLPYTLLTTKLNELINEAGRMASITRRGAGLSIMVHRIVASDMKKGKPLFHHFMKTLLATCKRTEDVPAETHNNPDIDNEKDLPKAIYIHFLTRIVTDSSLASDIMHYSASLGELAFSNLTSHCWQIRNAALQLYGALVSKFIGQKKSSGADEGTIATVASDEFRTHLPELWQHILMQLKSKDNSHNIQAHSDLVPILNLLANSAKRYNFHYDLESEDSYNRLFQSLMVLLGSPIYTVRRLTARCIYNNFSFELPFAAIKDHVFISENMLHGCLMLTEVYYRQDVKGLQKDKFSELNHIFSGIIYAKAHSYFSKAIFEEIFYEGKEPNLVQKLQESFEEQRENINAPGIHLWLNMRVQKYVKLAPWTEIDNVLKLLLDQDDAELYCEFLHNRLLVEFNDAPKAVLQSISDILLEFDNKFASSYVWKILYKTAPEICIEKKHIYSVCKHIKDNDFVVPYKVRYMIPFVASLTEFIVDKSFILNIANLVFSLIDEDFEMRFIAAIANNMFARSFQKFDDSVKVVVIRTAILCLQDEDEDVRAISVEFIKTITKLQHAPHPYIALQKIMTLDFLSTTLQDFKVYIPILCQDIANVLVTYQNCDRVDEYNPFANDSKNIYIEIGLLKMLIEKLKASCVVN